MPRATVAACWLVVQLVCARLRHPRKEPGEMTSNANGQQRRPRRRRSSGQARATGGVEGELRRFEPVPDELVLAAVERANAIVSGKAEACC